MADVATILAKVRALGADVVLDGGRIKIVNPLNLSEVQRQWLKENGEMIEPHLHDAGASSTDDGTPKPWTEFLRLLYRARPAGVDQCDWSWFVSKADQVVRGETEPMQ